MIWDLVKQQTARDELLHTFTAQLRCAMLSPSSRRRPIRFIAKGALCIFAPVVLFQILAYSGADRQLQLPQWLPNARAAVSKRDNRSDAKTKLFPLATSTSTAFTLKKPTLILHVGPMKTASTTIQRELLGIGRRREPHLFEESFRQDNIRVASKFGMLDFRRLVHECLEKSHLNDCNMDIWKQFVRDLESMLDNNDDTHDDQAATTVVYSSESLAWTPDTAVTRYLFQQLARDWDIRVLVFYRRPYDWVRSLYYQLRKANHYDTSTKQWRSFPTQKEYSNGNVKALKIGHKPTFVYPQLTLPEFLNPEYLQFTRDALETKEFFESLLSHPSNSSSVTTLDFYANHGIAVEFLCFGVSRESKSCQKARDLTASSSSTNIVRNAGESYLYEEDFLILEAHRQGFFQDKNLHMKNRHELTSALHQQFSLWNTTIQKLPQQICPNLGQKEWLWQRTINNNAHAAPSPVAEFRLRGGFQEFLESGKLCSVDAATILNSHGWHIFFRSACIFRESVDGSNCSKSFVLDARSFSPTVAGE